MMPSLLPLLLALEFHVAPMQGYTNAPLRFLLRKLAPDVVLWTEMEKVVDLLDASDLALDKRFGLDPDPIVIQLGGNDVDQMRVCVERICLAHDNNYRIRAFDLNCGCPSIESGGASSFGASMMKQPELTRDLLRTIQECSATASSSSSSSRPVDVSLKCRIAVFESSEDMHELGEAEYKQLHNYVTHAVEGGISQLVLHSRPVILSGLSPTKNRSAPPLNYEVVNRIASDFPDLSVVLNGGIQSVDMIRSFQQQHKNISGIMSGRWILRRPLDLIQVQNYLLGDTGTQPSVPDDDTIRLALSDYNSFLERTLASRHPMYTLGELCMPLYLVLEQLQEDDAEVGSDVHGILLETLQWLESEGTSGKSKKSKLADDNTSYKKMSASLKGLVGTKVFNKWKRNRAEL
jgi:tRNA-dihydrouridine synthase A